MYRPPRFRVGRVSRGRPQGPYIDIGRTAAGDAARAVRPAVIFSKSARSPLGRRTAARTSVGLLCNLSESVIVQSSAGADPSLVIIVQAEIAQTPVATKAAASTLVGMARRPSKLLILRVTYRGRPCGAGTCQRTVAPLWPHSARPLIMMASCAGVLGAHASSREANLSLSPG